MSPSEGNPPIIGLLGGIAAGKTTVAGMLVDLGATVVSADEIGHAVLERPETRERILARWGREVQDEAGKVDRRRLSEKVFGDPQELGALEAITHPAILASMREQIAKNTEAIAEQSRVTGERLENLRREMDERFESLRREMDERFESLRREMDERFQKMDGRFQKMDERFQKMDERFARLEERHGETRGELRQISATLRDILGKLDLAGRVSKLEAQMEIVAEKVGV